MLNTLYIFVKNFFNKTNITYNICFSLRNFMDLRIVDTFFFLIYSLFRDKLGLLRNYSIYFFSLGIILRKIHEYRLKPHHNLTCLNIQKLKRYDFLCMYTRRISDFFPYLNSGRVLSVTLKSQPIFFGYLVEKHFFFKLSMSFF